MRTVHRLGLEAADRMRALYGTPAPVATGPEALRRQLAALPDHVGAAMADAANRPSVEKLGALALQLDAAKRLVLQLQVALASEIAGGPPDA